MKSGKMPTGSDCDRRSSRPPCFCEKHRVVVKRDVRPCASLGGGGDGDVFFCDWNPKLFGIDEDEIPDSDNEESIFDFDLGEDWELEPPRTPKPELLAAFGQGPTNEMRKAWLRECCPKYGRRPRQKEILRRRDEPFECSCRVDSKYSRHYVPRFGGRTAKDEEELKVPHFKAFWEDIKDRAEIGDLDRLSKILNLEEQDKGPQRFPQYGLKFKNWNWGKIRKLRRDMLSSLRPMDCRDIRRYRIPYSEALYFELQEDGFIDAAAFFKHLIIKDNFAQDDPENSQNSRPRLRRNRLMLNKVSLLLRLAEKFSRREEYHKESRLYLRSGKYFNDRGDDWWWLAEEFYVKAVEVSEKCVVDDGKSEAIANYILGTFLVDCVENIHSAKERLNRALELSVGKDWSARNILKKPQDTVHKECVLYLCRALIADCKQLRKQNKHEEALPIIHRCRKLCEELGSWRSDIQMETYFELGLTYKALGMFDWAKVALRKFVELAETLDYVKGVCDGFKELAICHRSEGDMEKCLRNITSFLRAASARKNENLIALGNRFLGEFFLNNGNPNEATEHFDKAFNSFHDQYAERGNIPFEKWQPEHFTLSGDIELSRVLLGLAGGQMIEKEVLELIFHADKTNQDTMMRLLEWKDKGDRSIFLRETVHASSKGSALTKSELQDLDFSCLTGRESILQCEPGYNKKKEHIPTQAEHKIVET